MISVIVPAYNAEATIGECVRALQHQSLASDKYEIIVVDDGSADRTAELAAATGARVLQQAHQGPAAARNEGVQTARGEIIMFTDADCIPAQDWIEQMSAPLADAKVDGVKGAYATRQREVVARLAQLEFEERYDRLERSRFVDFFDSHALALRKSVLYARGSFDTFFPAANNEDVDLAYRFATVGSGLTFNRAAVVYHHHPSNWAVYVVQKLWRGYWRMQVYRRYPRKMLVDSYTPNNLKLQVLLAGLTFPAAALAVFGFPTGWIIAGIAGVLAISAWPLGRVAWRRDHALIPFVPLFIVVRALSIGLGVTLGVLTIAHVLPLMHPRMRIHREPGPADVM
jgi:glycosyltransferase involved in cell wall biosynthesis